MAICIDLKKHFGDRYHVTHEASYRAERGEGGRLHDPWLLTIRCKNGHIYPHGGDDLAASTEHRGRIANRLAALPGVRVLQDGTDGVNIAFHVDDFDQVADLMKPRRRRQLTPSQRVESTERLHDYQFKRAAHDAGGERRRDAALSVVSPATLGA